MRLLIVSCLMAGCANQVSLPPSYNMDQNTATGTTDPVVHTGVSVSSDQLTALALYSLIMDELFPHIVALGTEPITLNCATGNVVITGTQCMKVSTTDPKFVLIYDVQYHITNCQIGNWTFNGTVFDKGSWAENTVPMVELKSSNLTINGDVCAMDIVNTGSSNNTTTLSGNWCGRSL
jgi:hypothetical protein